MGLCNWLIKSQGGLNQAKKTQYVFHQMADIQSKMHNRLFATATNTIRKKTNAVMT